MLDVSACKNDGKKIPRHPMRCPERVIEVSSYVSNFNLPQIKKYRNSNSFTFAGSVNKNYILFGHLGEKTYNFQFSIGEWTQCGRSLFLIKKSKSILARAGFSSSTGVGAAPALAAAVVKNRAAVPGLVELIIELVAFLVICRPGPNNRKYSTYYSNLLYHDDDK
uniref:Uncharacterized protein n=1 Tax=Romanomermis culicivorax TaxID=13658 RepID=A0A915KBM3_ROMCU